MFAGTPFRSIMSASRRKLVLISLTIVLISPPPDVPLGIGLEIRRPRVEGELL